MGGEAKLNLAGAPLKKNFEIWREEEKRIVDKWNCVIKLNSKKDKNKRNMERERVSY